MALDTNLLLLLVVGSAGERLIGLHKRLLRFTAAHFRLLHRTIRGATVLVSPHVLAETSNLLRGGGVREPARSVMLRQFRKIIAGSAERHVPAIELIELDVFDRLGMADAGLVVLSGERAEVLTMDLGIYLHLAQRGLPVVNFAHLALAES